MDTKSIYWKFKFSNSDNKLWVNIKEYEEDRSTADIIIRSKTKIKIVNFQGIEILKIKY